MVYIKEKDIKICKLPVDPLAGLVSVYRTYPEISGHPINYNMKHYD